MKELTSSANWADGKKGNPKGLPASPKHPPQSKISVYNRQKDLKLASQAVKSLVSEVLSYLRVPFKEIGIYFVTEKKICDLHDQFFEDPTPTDCISFPIDKDHLGEIFVCPATAIKYAKKKNLDPFQETTLYMIHGILHLVGYDDLEPVKRRAMRKMEKRCMQHLKNQNIYLQ